MCGWNNGYRPESETGESSSNVVTSVEFTFAQIGNPLLLSSMDSIPVENRWTFYTLVKSSRRKRKKKLNSKSFTCQLKKIQLFFLRKHEFYFFFLLSLIGKITNYPGLFFRLSYVNCFNLVVCVVMMNWSANYTMFSLVIYKPMREGGAWLGNIRI